MRLITRGDTSLAVALIVGTLIAFERPFRWVLDLIHDVEQRYQIDLLPALTLLTVVFVFHQYSKRLQARTQVAALAGEMAHTRARTEELERLVALGQSLAEALDRQSLEQAIWRALPSFIDQRECSVLSRQPKGFEFLVRDVRMLRRHSVDALEGLVVQAASSVADDAAPLGVDVKGDLFFPMIAGGTVVGSIIVRDQPAMSASQRLALGAAGAVIGVALRNARLLQAAQESGASDGLTGCVTRAPALDQMQRELRRARRTDRPLSVIMFDIDYFKQINDRHGHLQGDAVLASVGAQLSQILRSTDVRCRYGGDEFLLILPDTPILGAQQVAEGLRRQIGDARRDGGLRVTASLGVASSLPGEVDPAAIIGRADEALYRAKRGGRDRWCATAGPAVAIAPDSNSGLVLVAAAG
ncbi:MAG TPA: GGDEF domain-containing protein [Vicinamibacterales bacterium]|nr:GGDEF domain-containing protein [Vicinamibacterales bacterium]